MRKSILGAALPMGAYVVLLLLSIWFSKAAPDSPWRLPLSLAPVLPIALIVFRGVPKAGEMDELERRIALEGSTISQRTAVVATLAYGFLQHLGFPALNMILVAVFLVGTSVVGRQVARWKYR
jgi:hypothetical protein